VSIIPKGIISPAPDHAARSQRFQSLNLFLDRGTSEGDLKPSESLTWLCLWAAERHGFVAMSLSQIARETNTDSHTVRRSLSSLKQKQMVKVVQRGDIHGHVNRYVLAPYPGATWGQIAHTPRGNLAQTWGQIAPHPERKEEGLPSSSFQTPVRPDVRPGDAPSVPAEKTNSDGGTIPLGPPSVEDQWKSKIRLWVQNGRLAGDTPETIERKIIDFIERTAPIAPDQVGCWLHQAIYGEAI